MALPLGKLTILIGAGIVGSVIAKEGSLPDVSGLGAFKVWEAYRFHYSRPIRLEKKRVSGFIALRWMSKVVLKQFKSSDPAPAVKKLPHNDALMAQVNSLRQELQLLARDRSITIVNSSGTGGKKYVTVIVIVVAGYGYVWWKGWKLPDLMFATKRSLSDACTSIGNQMGKLYGTIDDVKKKLSSRMNRLDESLDECAALTESTREEISVTQQKADKISGNFKSVHVAVRVLASRIKEIEEKQPSSSSSSRPAIELPPVSPSSRGSQSGSSRLSLEPPFVTPSAKDGSPSTISTDQPSPSNSGGSVQESRTNGSSSGLFGLGRLSGVYAPFLSRTRSATDSVVQQTRSTS
ncbi:uncharacterized protein HKW66_Vig0229460 [Vigna angularis]|uniref:DUF1664 domain-containing protein n=1 Tax=Phaseolus angularis TaxID=3914 RepID=A0A8T0KAR6_PHAAN|nr:uncharacterized protein HKW66_Vig0229460 [Vigna angularis]